MNVNWVPLWSDTLTSSLWSLGKPGLPEAERERGKNAKLLFLTMLALSDSEGFVSASFGGLADQARLTEVEARPALDVLEGPDPDSRNSANDGRRVRRVEGGWLILNYEAHRSRMATERRKSQNRQAQARQRAKQKASEAKAKGNGQPLQGEGAYLAAERDGASQEELDRLSAPVAGKKSLLDAMDPEARRVAAARAAGIEPA